MKHRILYDMSLISLAVAFYTVIRYGELYFIQPNRVNIILVALALAIIIELSLEAKVKFLKYCFAFLSSFIIIVAFCIIKQIIFEPVYFPDISSKIELKKYEEIKHCTQKVLSDKFWQYLSKSEKINLLQTIVNHEVAELKLKDSIAIEAAEIPAKGTDLVTNAHYNSLFDKIIIRSSLLDMTGDRALQSAIHEVRHAYQNSIAKSYEKNNTGWMSAAVLEDAKKFAKSLNHKRNNVQDYDQYYNELIECDARDYAAGRIKKTYQLICEYGEKISELPES